MDFTKTIRELRRHLISRKQAIGKGDSVASVRDQGPRPKGHLKVEKIYSDGTKEVVVDDRNLVVTQAETIMAQMSLGLRTMSYIELGDPTTVKIPELDDTALQQTTGLQKAISGSYSGGMGIYEATWTAGEGNGYTFTEAGLFSTPFGSGLLFARKAFSGIPKTSSFSLKFTWAITYSVQENNGGCLGASLIGPSTIASDYYYTAVGGETQLVIPIDFTVGAKHLDVFLNGQRLAYNQQYYESTISTNKGIILMSWTMVAGDKIYVMNRTLA